MLEGHGLFSRGPTSSNPFSSKEFHLILPDNKQTQCQQCNGKMNENNNINNINNVLISSLGVTFLSSGIIECISNLYVYMHINSNKRRLMMRYGRRLLISLVHSILCMKQRKIPNCTVGNIEPQHISSIN